MSDPPLTLLDTCQGTTADGARCRVRVSPPERYCHHHSPGGLWGKVRYIHRNKRATFWIFAVLGLVSLLGTIFAISPQKPSQISTAKNSDLISTSEWRKHLVPVPPAMAFERSPSSALALPNEVRAGKSLMIRMNFKDSPLLTPPRRENISRTVDNFYRYPTVEVGFDLPAELPPMGVSPRGSLFLAGGQKDAPIYYSHIIVPEDALDNPDLIRSAYSTYAFERALVPAQGPLVQMDEAAAWIFFCYYPSSFSGNQICASDSPEGKWRSALWEIRSRFGRAYTDKLLFYTFKMWETSVNKQENFDVFFFNKLLAGESAINNDMGRFTAISSVITNHGIRIQ